MLINIWENKLVRYNELKTFVWHNGKAQAMRGYNDDLVMACAIASWVRDTALVVNEEDIKYKKAMLEAFTTSKKTLDTTISGMKRLKQNNYIYKDKNKNNIVKIADIPFILR